MAAFHSCLEILFRPETPEVILCSLSRAAPSSPSPALAPGTSLPVRRGGGHGGGVAAVCAPVFLCAGGLPSLPPAHSRFASTQEEHRPRQRKQQLSANPSQKKETLESLRKTVAFVAVNPGLSAPVCWSCGWSPLPVRGLAVSACCPVLPEAVVGASRATRGRLASTQGCHRCSCPSPWARPLALRAVAVAAFPAKSASTQRGHRPRQQRQRSSATLSQKKRNRRSLRKHVACVAVRLPVLPLLSAVRLLLRSCGVSLLPLPVRLPVLPCRAASRSRRRRSAALAAGALRVPPAAGSNCGRHSPAPALLLPLAARFCFSSTQAATEATGFHRPLQGRSLV